MRHGTPDQIRTAVAAHATAAFEFISRSDWADARALFDALHGGNMDHLSGT
jgi:hypothetical protein